MSMRLMNLRLALAVGLAGGALAFAAPAATPAPVAPYSPAISQAAADGSLVRHAQSCRGWARICSYRWGWGTWRYRRCMRDHFC